MRLKILFLLIFLTPVSSNIFAQESKKHQKEVIIDPIFISCWELDPDSAIRPLIMKSKYVGRVRVEAEGDTVTLKFKNYKFPFAKLRSTEDFNDSIEIRMDYNIGNYSYFESIKEKIIEHLGYLKLKPTNYQNCDKRCIIFTIPVRIEQEINFNNR